MGADQDRSPGDRARAKLRERLAEIPGIRVRDVGARRCGITTFTVDGIGADRVRASLTEQGINISVSRTPSTRLDMDDRGLGQLLRASTTTTTPKRRSPHWPEPSTPCEGDRGRLRPDADRA